LTNDVEQQNDRSYIEHFRRLRFFSSLYKQSEELESETFSFHESVSGIPETPNSIITIISEVNGTKGKAFRDGEPNEGETDIPFVNPHSFNISDRFFVPPSRIPGS